MSATSTTNCVRTISASYLKLALVARKIRPGTKWAVISNGVDTYGCDPRVAPTSYRRPRPSLLTPLIPSLPAKVVERVRIGYGLDEVRKTWGTGYRALLAEISPRMPS